MGRMESDEEMLTPQQIAALEEIAKIRRIFDPGKEMMEETIRKFGPERALAILNLAARFGATLKSVH